MAGSGNRAGGATVRSASRAKFQKLAAQMVEGELKAFARDKDYTLTDARNNLSDRRESAKAKLSQSLSPKERERVQTEIRATGEALRTIEQRLDPRTIARARNRYSVEGGRQAYFRQEERRRQAAIDLYRQAGLDTAIPQAQYNRLQQTIQRARQQGDRFLEKD